MASPLSSSSARAKGNHGSGDAFRVILIFLVTMGAALKESAIDRVEDRKGITDYYRGGGGHLRGEVGTWATVGYDGTAGQNQSSHVHGRDDQTYHISFTTTVFEIVFVFLFVFVFVFVVAFCAVLLRLLLRRWLYTTNVQAQTSELVIEGVVRYTVDDLRCIVVNFKPNLIKPGALYQGRLSNTRRVGIQRVLLPRCSGIDQIMHRLERLATINHSGVSKLLGYCIHNDQLFVVSKVNGNAFLTLRSRITENNPPFEWKKGLETAKKIASALRYLHTRTEGSLCCLDFRSKTIHLNLEGSPTILNFQLAPSMTVSLPIDLPKSHYADPNLSNGELVSTQSDVYSFGMLLKVLLSRREPDNFPDPFTQCLRFQNQMSQETHNSMIKAFHLAQLCLVPQSIRRPTIQVIEDELKLNLRDLSAPPRRQVPSAYVESSLGFNGDRPYRFATVYHR